MLLRDVKRLFPLGVLIVLGFFLVRSYNSTLIPLPELNGPLSPGSSRASKTESKSPGKTGTHVGHPAAGYDEGAYHDLFSVSTPDKKYFPLVFDRQHAMNPNAIPHPTLENTWIMVAQLQRSDVNNTVFFAELVCNAAFKNNALSCVDPPLLLPISRTPGGEKCPEDIWFFKLSIGPHDARVFYGPSNPYVMFGSTSQYTCFGIWVADLRFLVDWGFEKFEEEQFRDTTEIQRPEPYGVVEKNFFIFWDKNEEMYGHYDISPKRVFAKLSWDGSAGPDLGPRTAENDNKCMAKYLPEHVHEHEAIHQSTNSLSITLCKRADPSCKPDDSNTFIMTIVQNKKGYDFHAIYDPYVMLFYQEAPFQLYGISSKPLWISGRGKPNAWKHIDMDHEWKLKNDDHPHGFGLDQTQMFYVVSMSWKTQGQKYHGYIDDVILVLFGIEDEDAGGIDVIASELVAGISLCAS